jgi:hypothetical protein
MCIRSVCMCPCPVLPRFSFHIFTIKVFLLDAHEVGVA